MALHQASGRWRLGLLLALITAGLWATLPIALKITLQQVDPYTLTWARFVFAALVTGIWLAARGRLTSFRAQPGRVWFLLILAAVTVVGNYLFYLLGVYYTTPANAQLLIQLAPLLMALGGIFVFRERFSGWQWAGLATIVIGMLGFFRDQLDAHSLQSGNYLFGSLLVLFGAVVWAVYALAQKQLLAHLSSQQVMLFIYALASVALLPFAHPQSLLALDRVHALALLYCALNTLGAYGAFAEALAHWEASRVSVILALTPLLCALCVGAAHALAPSMIDAERISWVGWFGAVLVVVGSVLTALRRRPAETSD
jgi:drug/metabolite transporter (DMT)-like permease